QVKVACPDLIVKSAGADHLICWKQPMQTGIANAGIQRPLVFLELLDYPTKEVGAAANTMVFPRMLPVGLVDGLSMPC
ncbi:MAG: hypothetical protein PUJ93_02205, partial [Oscillospiraceae bacterium]|nr:hypothetical protein [Oscillospiraceae bacterium]MDY5736392.1 hypothetical protein [Oscillospiraceae bacterium]